ncbi:nuclear transport factor 2 family protein [Nakamurella sp. YIM 132087]|uniref:Nuclear transport factor 2 family protein n=1 Tax=Nakamurella alba TaxID=2665158 RepID=A0A7K1FE91_9ACTN|nr:nuclear transport factor 2 family protein [Nakamurella alba]MTD12422.1 nuclear transport factor 2 family protein [Nakamurella alba]
MTDAGTGVAGGELRDVVAKAEIHEVLLRYFRAMDRIDDELGCSIFHEDGTGDYGADIFSGSGPDLIRWLNDYNRTLLASHHQMSNATIEVSGDAAASETYVTATLVMPAPQGVGHHVVRRVHGRYLDALSRRNGRWAIDHRRYRRDFFWEETVAGLTIGSGADRTPSDQSYAHLAAARTPGV